MIDRNGEAGDGREDDVLKLLTDHGPRLFALLVRLTLREDVAEDLMQELFIKLAQSGRLERAKDRLAYALRTATNLAFDWRRAQRKAVPTESDGDQFVASECAPLDRLVLREEVEQVLDAMVELSDLSRQIIVMRYLQQQDYEVIAEQLGKTPHHVRALSHKAVERLRILVQRRLLAQSDSGGR